MNITINTEALRAALSSASAIAKAKSSMPILANALLRAGDGCLVVTASDLSTTYNVDIAATVKAPGDLAINARKLFEVVSSLAADELTLRATENGAEIRCGKARFQLATLPPADFPMIHEAPTAFVEVDAKALRRIVDGVGFCCDLADGNPAFQGVFVDFESCTAMSASRVRCASMTLPLGKANGRALIPRAALGAMLKISAGDRFGIAVTPSEVYLRSGKSTISTKVIEADFPIKDGVRDVYFRQKSDHEVTVARVAFKDSLERVALVTSELTNHEVMVSVVNGRASLTCKGAGVAEDEMAVGYDGKGVERALSTRQLAEALDAIAGDEVMLGFNDNKFDPIVIRPIAEEMGEEHVAIVLGINR